MTLINLLNGQKPFSRIYDDPNPTSFENDLTGLLLVDNKILVNTVKYCDFDTISIDCSALSYFSINSGDLIQWLELDTVHTVVRSGLTKSDERIFLSCNFHSDFENFTNTGHVLEFDKDLNRISESTFEGSKNHLFQTRGSRVVGDYLYFYATSQRNPSFNYNFVKLIKYDYKNRTTAWEKTFTLGDTSGILLCDDVQVTHDGNLAFILYSDGYINPNNGSTAYQIIKLDLNGELIKSLIVEDIGKQKNRLLVGKDGSYYCSSSYNPNNHLDYPSVIGRINKFNKELDSLEWSLVLPNNQLIDGRKYIIENYTEARNGDILACGKVWDISDSNVPIFDVPNTTENGFIIRLNPEGNVIWLRVYRQPQTILDKQKYGHYRHSRLSYIVEHESGHLIAGGDVYYTPLQEEGIYKQKLDVEESHFWLLLVDENGCINKNDCNTKIYLTASEDIIRKGDNIEIYPNPVYEKLSFKNFTFWKGNFQIYDIFGNCKKSGILSGEIEVAELTCGVYFLNIQNNNHYSITLKFIKS